VSGQTDFLRNCESLGQHLVLRDDIVEQATGLLVLGLEDPGGQDQLKG